MRRLIPFFVSAALIAGAAYGHGTAPKTKKDDAVPLDAEQHPFGVAGDPKNVSRTITVEMSDAMRFAPADIKVKRGETIRFVIKNNGTLFHEMVIGTMAGLKAHGEAMKKNPEMEHDDPYGAHVASGKTGEIIWQFNRPGEFNFACLIAGHFEAGMVGKISVK